MTNTVRTASLAVVGAATLAVGVAPAMASEAKTTITAPTAGSTVTGTSVTVKGGYWASASVKEVRVAICTLDTAGKCTAYVANPTTGAMVTSYRSIPATLTPGSQTAGSYGTADQRAIRGRAGEGCRGGVGMVAMACLSMGSWPRLRGPLGGFGQAGAMPSPR